MSFIDVLALALIASGSVNVVLVFSVWLGIKLGSALIKLLIALRA